MPEHTELEIDSVISRQNVAKEGWTTYYVDGENGNDANNGLRWETAFKTIQHAVDVAESWAKIYVKGGTYVENVTIEKNFISIFGESRETVIVAPTSGNPLTISGNSCLIDSLFLQAPSAGDWCIYVTGNYETIQNSKFDGEDDSGCISLNGSDRSVIKNNYISNDKFIEGIRVIGACSYLEISHNIFNITKFGQAYIIYLESVSKSKIFENDLGSLSGGIGIFLDADTYNNTIFHNNFLGNGIQVDYGGVNNSFFENFYDDHTNVDNGFGIATEPYSFSGGGSDPRPVVCRNGWLGLGMSGNVVESMNAIESMNSTINDYIESIKSTISTGTITYASGTSEYIVLDILHHYGIQDLYISLDVSELTQPTEVREYEKIDETHYRQISCKVYPDDFDPGTKAILFSFKQKSRDYRITFRSIVAEGATRHIPYIIRMDGKVQ